MVDDASPHAAVHARLAERIPRLRQALGRPLTLAEKILYSHLDDPDAAPDITRGSSYLMLRPDRVTMQDATAQMALLQFMLAGLDEVAVPSTVHCDHLIIAQSGVAADLPIALRSNHEVYEFLRSCSARYGLGFWAPGSGIIHQTVLENHAFPGALVVGTDSHTPNGGGLGMVAIGVGGADAVDVMAGMPWELLAPGHIGARLTGSMSGWTASKDVILKMLDLLTVKGGTNHIIEYFGEGARAISATGKGTICNMGAELGATTSLFGYDDAMRRYLLATDREALVLSADAVSEHLRSDPEVEADPHAFYDQVIEIDLDRLAPHVVGPHTPDLAREVSAWGAEAAEQGWPVELTATLIGSCTNSSYEDIERVISLADQAVAAGASVASPLYISPGSDTIYETLRRDGQLERLEAMGATVLANACGPCIGQWDRGPDWEGRTNSILTSFNRNFAGRNDGNRETLGFIGSPEVVMAYALAGRLDTDPTTEGIELADGGRLMLEPPRGAELPEQGFVLSTAGYTAPVPVAERGGLAVVIAPGSERLERLAPFPAWDGADPSGLRVLCKAVGKCTTDHISPAGKWLRYRGHLTNISRNLLSGARNAFTDEVGHGTNPETGETGMSFHDLGRALQDAGVGWVIVGDENYGEGSSREHAAMEPRALGCTAVVVRSFARIAETNLKKQGVLPLTFVDGADHDLMRADDLITLEGVVGLVPGSEVTMVLQHADGSVDRCALAHTMSDEQVGWFVAGSALNLAAGSTHLSQ